MDTKAPHTPAASNAISGFLKDIEPFFLRRQVIYADIGANRGDTFAAIYRSPLKVNRACLVEANPKICQQLQQTVSALEAEDRATCLNLAISDAPGTVKLRDMRDMSSVVRDGEGAGEQDNVQTLFDVEARTLDSLATLFPDGHISILKIDVEGHEAEVLKGAETLLANHAIEVIYIEAGVNRENAQQTYYRTIEDILLAHDYRLFRIYEQTHEWIDDRPVLRRMNMAFVSPVVAAKYPLSLLKELQHREAVLDANRALKKDLADKEKEVVSLTRAVIELEQETRNAEDLEKRCRKLEKDLARITDEFYTSEKQFRDHKQKLSTENAALTKRAAQSQARVRDIEKSTSWRITAPVRALGRAIRPR
ncbi:FkbM family methyltransferase [Tropicimonas sp.]|uniref:FkbM family methyltransferase n=1 Tax=Tropicimonas sp. TaxID=2067044 RepID=UPI003A881571